MALSFRGASGGWTPVRHGLLREFGVCGPICELTNVFYTRTGHHVLGSRVRLHQPDRPLPKVERGMWPCFHSLILLLPN